MLLADGGISVIWIGGLLLVGLVALIAVVLRALARAVGFVCRLLLGRPRRATRPTIILDSAGRVCPRPRCGHWNQSGARYCARCGLALPPARMHARHG